MFTSETFIKVAKKIGMVAPKWFIDILSTGFGFITKTGKKIGTVVMPTGFGKSAQMFANAIRLIQTTDGKIVLIFAGPILRLVAQTMNQFLEWLGDICHDLRDSEQIRFFVNSSASGEEYKYRDINANPYNFDKDFTRHFINDSNAKVALIASCYDSLYKVADKIEKINNSGITSCAYLDEAHLMIVNGKKRDSISEDEAKAGSGESAKKAKQTYDVLRKLCKCDYLYAVTATPDDNITKVINEEAYKKYNDESYCENNFLHRIVNIEAKEAIHDNIILPFNMDVIAAPVDILEFPITVEMCVSFMEHVRKNDKNKVPHKILINCINSKHLAYLRDRLIRLGYKVYSTCSKEGTMASQSEEEQDGKFQAVNGVVDANNFIDMIDNDTDDCFILHIYQLTQGIDIKTLTDTIMYVGDVPNVDVKRRIIQRIGRILRTLGKERGANMEERNKKYGNVFFVLPDGDTCSHIGGSIERLITQYYGFDGVLNLAHGHDGRGSEKGGHKTIITDDGWRPINPQDDVDIAIVDWKINLSNYVQNELVKKHKKYIEWGFKNVAEQMEEDIKNYSNKYLTECEWVDLVTDKYLMDTFKELCDAVGIDLRK